LYDTFPPLYWLFMVGGAGDTGKVDGSSGLYGFWVFWVKESWGYGEMPGGGLYGVPYGADMGVASPPLWYASPLWSMSGLLFASPTLTPERLFFWRRRQKNARRPRSARTTIPPTTPPTMGPVFDFFFPPPLLLLGPEVCVGDEALPLVCVVWWFVAVDSGAEFPMATCGSKMFVVVTLEYAHAGTPVPTGMSSGNVPT